VVLDVSTQGAGAPSALARRELSPSIGRHEETLEFASPRGLNGVEYRVYKPRGVGFTLHRVRVADAGG